ncbi:uncharacterized protein LOC134817720 isoform X1 [Bolinopsis microptera]|uniref:uncharacterized protein LOC134817720 isoform X1 n=1 Tax=Bolinopsis microptera TaxID=2820187 RepID=UPI003078FAA8
MSGSRTEMFAGLTVTRQLRPLGSDGFRRRCWLHMRARFPTLEAVPEIKRAVARFCHIEESGVHSDWVREVQLRYKKYAVDKKCKRKGAAVKQRAASDHPPVTAAGTQTDPLHALHCKDCVTNAMRHVLDEKAAEIAEMRTNLLLHQAPSPTPAPVSSILIRTPDPIRSRSRTPSVSSNGPGPSRSSHGTPVCAVQPRSRINSAASSISADNWGPESVIEARVRMAAERKKKGLSKEAHCD